MLFSRARGHPSRRAQVRALQDDVRDSFTGSSAALHGGFLVLDKGGDDILLRQRDGFVGRRRVVSGVEIGKLQREVTDQRHPEILPLGGTDIGDMAGEVWPGY